MEKQIKKKIAIIGCGRFGLLLGRIFKDYGEVVVIDKRELKTELKQIDHSGLSDMDWVVFAVPISALKEAVLESVEFLSPQTLVMDVCSVKCHPLEIFQKYLPDSVEILGTHPMFGPDSAKYGLEGLQLVLSPQRISSASLEEVRDFFSGFKLSLLEMSPEEHDRQIAKSLTLVHYLGRALNKMDLKSLSLTTLGLERLMAIDETVNNDSWELFFDMNRYNPYTEQVRQELRDNLQDLENQIKKEEK